ncbi:MAG: hypothetical protein H8E73_07935 [Planctomycetes bacterium]|nr:hypothetical protein [Planctomycetota bacterium]MBL7189174.1 hypothetical protein [Phycisphaerae bacterium]
MPSVLRRFVLRPVSNWFDGTDILLTRLGARKLKKQLLGKAMDSLIELLLRAMSLSFYLIKDDDYQNHLHDSKGKPFEGRYLFQTAKEDGIIASATFENGDMHVRKDAMSDWDVKVTFTDGKALRKFLFSEDQDIINSLAENEVEVEGNLNYIYKFGFMAKDLLRRIDVVLGDV